MAQLCPQDGDHIVVWVSFGAVASSVRNGFQPANGNFNSLMKKCRPGHALGSDSDRDGEAPNQRETLYGNRDDSME